MKSVFDSDGDRFAVKGFPATNDSKWDPVLADTALATILTITNPMGVIAVCWDRANGVRATINVAARVARAGV